MSGVMDSGCASMHFRQFRFPALILLQYIDSLMFVGLPGGGGGAQQIGMFGSAMDS